MEETGGCKWLPLDPDVADSAAEELSEQRWRFTTGDAILVFVGGLLGTAARDALSAHYSPSVGDFPTLIVVINVSGALLLGVLLAVLATARSDRRHHVRLLAGTGLLGGWTTYSTFALDTIDLLRRHDLATAVVSAAVTVLAGAIATAFGAGTVVRLRSGRDRGAL